MILILSSLPWILQYENGPPDAQKVAPSQLSIIELRKAVIELLSRPGYEDVLGRLNAQLSVKTPNFDNVIGAIINFFKPTPEPIVPTSTNEYAFKVQNVGLSLVSKTLTF